VNLIKIARVTIGLRYQQCRHRAPRRRPRYSVQDYSTAPASRSVESIWRSAVESLLCGYRRSRLFMAASHARCSLFVCVQGALGG
jgi:hypothetical protein